jgi:hypothetical protein
MTKAIVICSAIVAVAIIVPLALELWMRHSEAPWREARAKAYAYSLTVDLNQFNSEELCELYTKINNGNWEERLGQKPKASDEKYDCIYTVSLMNRIVDKVGHKAVTKWWNIRETGRSEDEFEAWYEREFH